MATVNLGSIKFKWKGTYSGATAYTVDDVVEYNGSSYICKLASTGNLPTNTTYFDVMSSAGTNGTDLTSTLTTQGDLVYRDGSGLQRLGAGTAGQVLQTGGAGANPSWADASGGGLEFLHKETISSAGTIDVDNVFSSTYNSYKVVLIDVTPATNATNMYMQLINNAGTVETGSNYRSLMTGGEGFSASVNNTQARCDFDTTSWNITPAGSTINNNTEYGGVCGEFILYSPFNTSKRTKFLGNTFFQNQAGSGIHGSIVSGLFNANTSTQYRGLRFLMNSGNIASGIILIYGVKEA